MQQFCFRTYKMYLEIKLKEFVLQVKDGDFDACESLVYRACEGKIEI